MLKIGTGCRYRRPDDVCPLSIEGTKDTIDQTGDPIEPDLPGQINGRMDSGVGRNPVELQ